MQRGEAGTDAGWHAITRPAWAASLIRLPLPIGAARLLCRGASLTVLLPASMLPASTGAGNTARRPAVPHQSDAAARADLAAVAGGGGGHAAAPAAAAGAGRCVPAQLSGVLATTWGAAAAGADCARRQGGPHSDCLAPRLRLPTPVCQDAAPPALSKPLQQAACGSDLEAWRRLVCACSPLRRQPRVHGLPGQHLYSLYVHPAPWPDFQGGSLG